MPDVTDTRAKLEILADVFAQVAGGTSINAVFAQSPATDNAGTGLPSKRTFWRWVASDGDVMAAYLAALKTRGYTHVEEIFAIADELADKALTPEQVAVARLRVDVRKWNAARMLPKLYGDRTVIAGDAANPVAFADVTNPKAALLRGLTPKPAGSGTPGESSGADE